LCWKKKCMFTYSVIQTFSSILMFNRFFILSVISADKYGGESYFDVWCTLIFRHPGVSPSRCCVILNVTVEFTSYPVPTGFPIFVALD
jgi:hypothetical protein